VQQLKAVTEGFDNIQIEQFQGLLMDFAKQKNAKVVIRGLRAVTDFEYEFQMALANRSLTKEVETIFLTTSTQYLFLSSSVVKEIASFGGNIDEMVPPYVADKIKEKYI
jgi:pantetheine-phosphate adenylyltransferase